MDQLFDFIIVFNFEYSKPIKWQGLTHAEFKERKKEEKLKKNSVLLMSAIKSKTKNHASTEQKKTSP